MSARFHNEVALTILIVLSGLMAAQPLPAAPPPPAPVGDARPVVNAPPDAPQVNSASAPNPGAAASVGTAPVDPHTYKIGAEDVIGIRVWREPEISGPYTVRPDGKFTMPLIGELSAAGLTPEELREQVATKLGQFYNKPDVIVSVLSVLSKKFSIIGEVNRTGTFPLVTTTKVLDALAEAGGFREFAKTSKITVLRAGHIYHFNYNEVIKGKKLEQNIALENGDLIIVR